METERVKKSRLLAVLMEALSEIQECGPTQHVSCWDLSSTDSAPEQQMITMPVGRCNCLLVILSA